MAGASNLGCCVDCNSCAVGVMTASSPVALQVPQARHGAEVTDAGWSPARLAQICIALGP